MNKLAVRMHTAQYKEFVCICLAVLINSYRYGLWNDAHILTPVDLMSV